jgi:hypothetical protein
MLPHWKGNKEAWEGRKENRIDRNARNDPGGQGYEHLVQKRKKRGAKRVAHDDICTTCHEIK